MHKPYKQMEQHILSLNIFLFCKQQLIEITAN